MKAWLPDMDLNHDKQIQSLLCYRYTIGQTGASKVERWRWESRLPKGDKRAESILTLRPNALSVASMECGGSLESFRGTSLSYRRGRRHEPKRRRCSALPAHSIGGQCGGAPNGLTNRWI